MSGGRGGWGRRLCCAGGAGELPTDGGTGGEGGAGEATLAVQPLQPPLSLWLRRWVGAMADVSGDPTVFTATALPADPRLLPTLTNACLGTRLYRDVLHLNGVYNGAAGDTHRAGIPSPLNVRMGLPGGGAAETFTLDTQTGGCTAGHVPVPAPPPTAAARPPAALQLLRTLCWTLKGSLPVSRPPQGPTFLLPMLCVPVGCSAEVVLEQVENSPFL